MSLPELEICSTFKDFDNFHPLLKAMYDVLGESAKPLFKGCPYEGNFNLSMTLNDKEFPSIIPSGMYKVEVTVKKNDQLFQTVMQVEVVSSIKTSF